MYTQDSVHKVTGEPLSYKFIHGKFPPTDRKGGIVRFLKAWGETRILRMVPLNCINYSDMAT